MADVVGGAGQIISGAGSFFTGITNFFARNFFTIVMVVVAGAILYYCMWRFFINDTRVVVRKQNGLTAIAPARIYFDKKLQAKRISIVGFQLHDEQAPSEEGMVLFKGFFKLYRGYNAIQDNNGFIHFVHPKINEKHEYMLNVISPTKVEQYIASRERAWRKFKIKDEQREKMILVSLIVYTLIMSASLAWGYYQQKQGSEDLGRGIEALAGQVQRQNDLFDKYASVAISQGITPVNNVPVQDTTTVEIPFNNG